MINLRISFCVVCMNRLHHLKITLPKNIDDNKDYTNLEFIVLNYNSRDEMEDWMHENMTPYIQSGLIKYYRTPSPKTFFASHSKNMALKLATGDVVCNINADHFIGKGFAHYVNDLFNKDPGIIITPIDYFETLPNYKQPFEIMGKVCVKKTDFDKVTGFDEAIRNYGFEDVDFINRLELLPLKLSFIQKSTFLEFISHPDKERFSLEELVNNFHSVYFHYITETETEILILNKDFTYKTGVLVDDFLIDADNPKYSFVKRSARYKLTMKDMRYTQGIWTDKGSYLLITDRKFIKGEKNNHQVLFPENQDKIFYCITNSMIMKEIANFINIYPGRAVMEKNLVEKKIVVNKEFGAGMVYKNFNNENPIYL